MDWTFSLLSQNSADLVMVSSQTEYISCYCYPWSFNAWRKDFRHCHSRNRNKIDPSQMKIEKPIHQEARRTLLLHMRRFQWVLVAMRFRVE